MTTLRDEEIVTVVTDDQRFEPAADADGDDTDADADDTDADADDTDSDADDADAA
jgi:hypothetical protein